MTTKEKVKNVFSVYASPKDIYQAIDSLSKEQAMIYLSTLDQDTTINMSERTMKNMLKDLVRFYMYGKKINSPHLKLDVIKVHSSVKTIEFEYKGSFYIYKYRSDNNAGLAYIYDGTNEEIYSPYPKERTKEGEEVYQALWDQIITKNK